ncbi:MAG: thioredoxin-dependent thiol peroxidase [Saprospiraceae bacterium]
MTTLKIGDKAPSFSITDQDGKIISNETISGQKVVLFFYPKDATPGCTAEACDLRDNYDKFLALGYSIYGISPDSEKKHQKFIAKYDFPFSLLADEDKTMLKAFGVWGPKKFMGKSYVGVLRTTFIIDEYGIITAIIDKVKTKVHANQLFDIIE